jgi:hypothetical protein
VSLHEPDDAVVRQVAEGLVRLTGTAHAAAQLDRLYGRERAVRALDRRHGPPAVTGAAPTEDDATRQATAGRATTDVTLDLTQADPVLHLRDAYAPAAPPPPRRVYWL